jgi:hypothetical protein
MSSLLSDDLKKNISIVYDLRKYELQGIHKM